MAAQQNNTDQVAFWNGDAGQKWVRSQERLDRMLSLVSDKLLEAAKPAASDRVLDIGCGCGDTSIALAKSGAKVTGIDISAPMLAHARHRAPDLTFLETDASTYAFQQDFSLLVSRFGVMFFSNPDAAFANLRRALAPSGRVAFACWRDWRENEWVRVPMTVARPLLPPQPPMGPEDPGPFSFADLGRVRRILANAGFDRIEARPVDVPMEMGKTVDEAVVHLQEIGPVSRMLTDAEPALREKVVSAIREAVRPYGAKLPVTLGGAIWIVTAVSP
jgi:SAM-dependent methyltransferase